MTRTTSRNLSSVTILSTLFICSYCFNTNIFILKDYHRRHSKSFLGFHDNDRWSDSSDNFVSSDSNDVIIINGETIWSSRRKIINKIANVPFVKSSLQQSNNQTLEINDETRKQKSDASTNTSLVFSAGFIAILVLIFRIGGRVALFQVLGLDSLLDENTTRQIQDFLEFFNSLENYKYVTFFLAWLVTKSLCIDAIGIGLALSAGILFDGVWQGTAASIASSSLASLIVFLVVRYFFRDKAKLEIEKRPAFRAIDRACSNKGFQTILTLRLSPILPIPIGKLILS